MKKVLVALLILAAIGGSLLYTTTGQNVLLSRVVAARIAGAGQAEFFDGLRVFMCGTSSPLQAAGRAQACVAVLAGEAIYIVDAGAGAALTTSLARLPLNRLRAVLLTHFHSDHIASVADFNLNSWVAGRPEPLRVIGPVGVSRVVEGLNEAYALDRGYRVAHHGADLLPPDLHVMRPQQIEPGLVLEANGLVVTALEVNHPPVSPAVAYRFDYRGRSVVISGDTLVTEELLTFVADSDLVLHDALSLRLVKALEGAAAGTRMSRVFHDIQDYHASVDSLDSLTGPGRAQQLALYHLVPSPQNLLFKQIYLKDMPEGAVLTEDAMTFELPADSDAITW